VSEATTPGSEKTESELLLPLPEIPRKPFPPARESLPELAKGRTYSVSNPWLVNFKVRLFSRHRTDDLSGCATRNSATISNVALKRLPPVLVRTFCCRLPRSGMTSTSTTLISDFVGDAPAIGRERTTVRAKVSTPAVNTQWAVLPNFSCASCDAGRKQALSPSQQPHGTEQRASSKPASRGPGEEPARPAAAAPRPRKHPRQVPHAWRCQRE
jgi:hypothetical protein